MTTFLQPPAKRARKDEPSDSQPVQLPPLNKTSNSRPQVLPPIGHLSAPPPQFQHPQPYNPWLGYYAYPPPKAHHAPNPLPGHAPLALESGATQEQLSGVIGDLNLASCRSILHVAAETYPTLASFILQQALQVQEKEKSKIHDFDYLSKDVWKEINIRFKKLSSSKQYEEAGTVMDEVSGSIGQIREKTPQHASFGTKLSALETLRKIGKTICLSSNVIGHEVRKNFHHDSILEDAVGGILREMRREELDRILGNTELLDKYKELKSLAASYVIFPEFNNNITDQLWHTASLDEDGSGD